MNFSVIIATYNRCEELKNVLDSLLAQEIKNAFEFETLIVDNNSNDKTKEVVESYILNFNGKLRYIFESSQGLSYARNRGIKEAKGEIIAFTDDDILVDKFWIANIVKNFLALKCDAIGGRILTIYPKNTPNWIKNNADLLKGPLGNYDYGEKVQIYDKSKLISFFGGNMAFRKELFNVCGLFRTDLGVGQNKIGEETEFLRRVEEKFNKLYYCGDVLVWHKVDKKRVDLAGIAKWWIASGRFAVATDYDKPADNIVYCFGIPRYLIRKIVCDMVGLFFRIFNTRTFLKKWNELFWNIGRAYEYRRK